MRDWGSNSVKGRGTALGRRAAQSSSRRPAGSTSRVRGRSSVLVHGRWAERPFAQARARSPRTSSPAAPLDNVIWLRPRLAEVLISATRGRPTSPGPGASMARTPVRFSMATASRGAWTPRSTGTGRHSSSTACGGNLTCPGPLCSSWRPRWAHGRRCAEPRLSKASPAKPARAHAGNYQLEPLSPYLRGIRSARCTNSRFS